MRYDANINSDLNSNLSKQYLEVITTFFKLKIFNKKVVVFFYFFSIKNKALIYLEKSI